MSWQPPPALKRRWPLFRRASSPWSLVILDYEMPVMKGDKLAAAIRSVARQQPIIMITAYGESLRHAGDFPLAVDRVIDKPFDLQTLREAVRQLAKNAARI